MQFAICDVNAQYGETIGIYYAITILEHSMITFLRGLACLSFVGSFVAAVTPNTAGIMFGSEVHAGALFGAGVLYLATAAIIDLLESIRDALDE